MNLANELRAMRDVVSEYKECIPFESHVWRDAGNLWRELHGASYIADMYRDEVATGRPGIRRALLGMYAEMYVELSQQVAAAAK